METKREDILSVFIDYEVRSSTWTKYIKYRWLQKIAGKYFFRLANKKFRRYEISRAQDQAVLDARNEKIRLEEERKEAIRKMELKAKRADKIAKRGTK
jgi:hypothetical protein